MIVKQTKVPATILQLAFYDMGALQTSPKFDLNEKIREGKRFPMLIVLLLCL